MECLHRPRKLGLLSLPLEEAASRFNVDTKPQVNKVAAHDLLRRRWDATNGRDSLGRWRLDSILIQLGQRSFLLSPHSSCFNSCQEAVTSWKDFGEALRKEYHSRPRPSAEKILLARNNEELDNMTRPHNMIASRGTLNERLAESLKYFHNVHNMIASSGERNAEANSYVDACGGLYNAQAVAETSEQKAMVERVTNRMTIGMKGYETCSESIPLSSPLPLFHQIPPSPLPT